MSGTARILIVGAGQAGGRTAQALRRAGHSGPIALLGSEAWPPYERPPLSKDVLLGKASGESLLLASEAAWREQDITLYRDTTVIAIDRAARAISTARGERLGYDVLVLATGADARAFPGAVLPGANVLQLRTLADAQRLRPHLVPGRRVVLIGAGFIGLEVAASARSLGAEVTLIEAEDRPLARLLPAELGGRLVALHRSRGVAFEFGVRVSAVEQGSVRLSDGRSLAADTVVVGIGARPNDSLAAAAGLAVRDGIVVDTHGRTSDPAIYAAGDAARTVDAACGRDDRLESWRNAEDSALAVAAAICGTQAPRAGVCWFWSDQYGHNIQIAGQPGDLHQRIDRHAPDGGPQLSYYLQDGVVRGVVGIDCAREVRGAMKLIASGEAVDSTSLAAPRVRAPTTPAQPTPATAP